MQLLDTLAFWQWVVQVLVIIFIVGGLVGLAVGYGLYANSARTLAFFKTINHWTSMRETAKPLETSRDTTAIVQKYMRVFAAIFVVGGLYSLYALLVQFNAEAIIFSLKLGNLHPLISGLILDGVRWVLIAGNLGALAVGAMMILSPDKLTALEARGSRWFSNRAITEVGDRMHTPLDGWVAAAPRTAGVIIAIGSLIVVVSAVVMLFVQR